MEGGRDQVAPARSQPRLPWCEESAAERSPSKRRLWTWTQQPLQTKKTNESLCKLRLDPLRKNKPPAKMMPALKLNSASAFTSTLVIHFTPKITSLLALGILTLSEREPCPAEFRNCLFYIIPLGAARVTEPLYPLLFWIFFPPPAKA